MRKYLLLLLAGVAAPSLAAADPGDNNNHRWNRDSGQQSKSEDHGDRSGRRGRETCTAAETVIQRHFIWRGATRDVTL